MEKYTTSSQVIQKLYECVCPHIAEIMRRVMIMLQYLNNSAMEALLGEEYIQSMNKINELSSDVYNNPASLITTQSPMRVDLVNKRIFKNLDRYLGKIIRLPYWIAEKRMYSKKHKWLDEIIYLHKREMMTLLNVEQVMQLNAPTLETLETLQKVKTIRMVILRSMFGILKFPEEYPKSLDEKIFSERAKDMFSKMAKNQFENLDLHQLDVLKPFVNVKFEIMGESPPDEIIVNQSLYDDFVENYYFPGSVDKYEHLYDYENDFADDDDIPLEG